MRIFQSELERRLWNDLRCGADARRAVAAIRLAALLRNRGELEAAHDLLASSAAVRDPAEAARAWLALAEFLAEIGEATASMRAYARTAELANPRLSPDVSIDLAARAEQNGNRRGAAALYEAVIAAEPETSLLAVAALRLAAIHRAEDHLERAIASLRLALENAGADLRPTVELELAEDLLSVDRSGMPWEEAQALLDAVIAVDHPDLTPQAALIRARELRARGSFERAYELLRAVIECGHPDFRIAAEAELSSLMHAELEQSLRARQEASCADREPSAMLPEFCLSTEESEQSESLWRLPTNLSPPQGGCCDEHEQLGWLSGQWVNRVAAEAVVGEERGVNTYRLRFNSDLVGGVDIVMPRLVLARLDFGPPSPSPRLGAGLRSIFTRIRGLLAGSAQMRLRGEELRGLQPHSRAVQLQEICSAERLQLDLGSSLCHALGVGAGLEEIQQLLLALTGFRRTLAFEVDEFDWSDTSWQERTATEVRYLGSMPDLWGRWSEAQQWGVECVDHDRLSLLASGKWFSLAWFNESHEHRRRAEAAIDAAISIDSDRCSDEPAMRS
jgi:tetratricopeptide (TPR) repeat protein